MSGTTRVTVDVPNELLADGRDAFRRPREDVVEPTLSTSEQIARLVVDAAPDPVEVTITLAPEEARVIVGWTSIDEVMAERLALLVNAALRAQGYGS